MSIERRGDLSPKTAKMVSKAKEMATVLRSTSNRVAQFAVGWSSWRCSVPNAGAMMGWIRDFLKPRQNSFLRLLIQQAEWTVQGIEALEKYMKKRSAKHAERVDEAEKEADEVRRILIEELNRTFVTPLDREDIFSLSRAIDDVVDYAYTTVDEMETLDVEPNNYLRRMTSLLGDAAREILLAMHRLDDHPNVANDHAVRAKALENRMERVYREAVADLFHQPQDEEHIVEMLKLREIYRHLNNAADQGDEAANIISDIVVKMV